MQEPRTCAAQFSSVILDYGVSSVVSDDVVGAVAEEFDAAALDEFACFLVHQISRTHLQISTKV